MSKMFKKGALENGSHRKARISTASGPGGDEEHSAGNPEDRIKTIEGPRKFKREHETAVMRYGVKGNIGGNTYGVTYSKLPGLKPKLTGDAVAVKFVEHKAKLLEGRLIGPVGMYFDKDYLNDPLAALFVMLEVFDEIIETSGDVPEAPDVPDGAIG
ncbi:MAG: hypothetical protein ACYDEJ_09530 [Desulfitobacteriaceae bacterium]